MCEYELQEPKLIATTCSGRLTAILPDDDFTFFGFHAKVNEEMEGLETGTMNEESYKMSEDNEWIVCIKNSGLSDGDTLHYWIHVIRNGKEYHKTGSWKVKLVRKTPCMGPLQIIMDKYEENYEEIEAASIPPPTPEVEASD